MKIVVLDGYALNPGDLSWEPLRALGECVIYDRTPDSEILARAQGAAAVLTNKTPLRTGTLTALPDLRYIGVLATGYDVIDVAQAARQNILVTNVPEYSTDSVAQMTFALLLELVSHVGLHSEAVMRGEWSSSPDFCFWRKPGVELSGKTLGLVGYGRIGRRVGAIAQAFGMKLTVTSTHRPADLPSGATWDTLESVLAQSDVVSLHCPLRPETRNLINAARIGQMKPGAFLINTSRGALVVEEDLAAALRSGRLAGAALDVLTNEPPRTPGPLIGAPHCIITPHIAWATREARSRLLQSAVENLKMWCDGTPQNAVS